VQRQRVEGDAKQMISTQHTIRELAIRCDAEAASGFELRLLWERLRTGAWVFSDTFSTSERSYAVLRSPVEPNPLNPRKLRILERILLGTQAKVVAIEDCCSLSSVTTAMQDTLRAMGLDCRTSQASVLLTMAATAVFRHEFSNQQGRLCAVHANAEPYVVISALRPDRQFPVELSLAEAAVLRSLIAGSSHAEISDERSRSPRTVANQLATAFRKLGVSGRRAIIERLIQHSAQLG
jgi:DNA-binding NarL/FixJ family response regulator